MKPLSISVVSDVICPWCYLGKRRLEAALREVGAEATVNWLPYELNPDMPPEGMKRTDYRAEKFGAERAAQFDAQLASLGAAEGIPFAFARMERTPNTRRAHQLITYASGEGRADAAVEALFRACFEEARDIGDEGVLVDIAASVGLGTEAARAAIRDSALAKHVVDLERQAMRLGVQGVPFFIVDEAWAVSGAQPAETWVAAIRERRAFSLKAG